MTQSGGEIDPIDPRGTVIARRPSRRALVLPPGSLNLTRVRGERHAFIPRVNFGIAIRLRGGGGGGPDRLVSERRW